MRKLLYCGLAIAGLLAGCEKAGSEKTVYSGKTAMRITHSVKNFPEWLKVYKEVSDSAARISVYISPQDSLLVTLYELTSSHEAARDEMNSGRLRNIMKRSGVTSEPEITYFDIKYRNFTKSTKQYRIEITHDVADYEEWKKMFDSLEGDRSAAGLELRGIFVDAENPNMVGVVLATDDLETFYKRLNSEKFQDIKKQAGVASKEVVRVLKLPPVQ